MIEYENVISQLSLSIFRNESHTTSPDKKGEARVSGIDEIKKCELHARVVLSCGNSLAKMFWHAQRWFFFDHRNWIRRGEINENKVGEFVNIGELEALWRRQLGKNKILDIRDGSFNENSLNNSCMLDRHETRPDKQSSGHLQTSNRNLSRHTNIYCNKIMTNTPLYHFN